MSPGLPAPAAAPSRAARAPRCASPYARPNIPAPFHHPSLPSTLRGYCRRVQHRIRSAKRAARSELSISRGEWRRRGYADANAVLGLEGLTDGVPRVHISVGAGSAEPAVPRLHAAVAASGSRRCSGRPQLQAAPHLPLDIPLPQQRASDLITSPHAPLSPARPPARSCRRASFSSASSGRGCPWSSPACSTRGRRGTRGRRTRCWRGMGTIN